TLLIDHETIFDPRNSNDRLLLGLKGNLSAYELDQLRHRALEARRAKARRGELFMALPPGFIKTDDGRVEKDPDRRVQHTIEVLIPGHHEGYVSQEIFASVQHMLSNNASRMEGSQGPSKLGIGLLTGLLRCARCGRKLRVNYTGTPRFVRYTCDQAQMNSGTG